MFFPYSIIALLKSRSWSNAFLSGEGTESTEEKFYVVQVLSGAPYLLCPSFPHRKPNSIRGQKEIIGINNTRENHPDLLRSCALFIFIIIAGYKMAKMIINEMLSSYETATHSDKSQITTNGIENIQYVFLHIRPCQLK